MSDPSNLDAIYRRHGAAVFRRARQILGHDADAYEVVQDVFLALLEHPEQYRGASALTTYLYSATTHACLNRIRNQKNRARLQQQHFTASELAVRTLTPEQMSLLHRAIRTMPDDLCQAAIHYVLDGLTHDEIAQVMKCSRRHVGDLLARVAQWNSREEVPPC